MPRIELTRQFTRQLTRHIDCPLVTVEAATIREALKTRSLQ